MTEKLKFASKEDAKIAFKQLLRDKQVNLMFCNFQKNVISKKNCNFQKKKCNFQQKIVIFKQKL